MPDVHGDGPGGMTVLPVPGQEDGDRPELDAGRALEALRWCWGEVYEIWIDQDMGLWLAKRRDGMGVIESSGPEELCTEIMEDWLLRPVVVRR